MDAGRRGGRDGEGEWEGGAGGTVAPGVKWAVITWADGLSEVS